MKLNKIYTCWVIMDVDRTVIAKGTPRNRCLVPLGDTKKRYLTYTSKNKAENGFKLSGFYRNSNPKREGREYKLEAVQVEISIKEL